MGNWLFLYCKGGNHSGIFYQQCTVVLCLSRKTNAEIQIPLDMGIVLNKFFIDSLSCSLG